MLFDEVWDLIFRSIGLIITVVLTILVFGAIFLLIQFLWEKGIFHIILWGCAAFVAYEQISNFFEKFFR